LEFYRISKQQYANDLSGEGARINGGRWNPIGTPALYSSENRSLCILELLANTPSGLIPKNYVILTDNLFEQNIKDVSKLIKGIDWKSPQLNFKTQQLGKEVFTKENMLGIYVPSSIVTEEFNLVLNPMHKNYKKVKIKRKKPVKLDDRLF